jgi:hypothetical protein
MSPHTSPWSGLRDDPPRVALVTNDHAITRRCARDTSYLESTTSFTPLNWASENLTPRTGWAVKQTA